VTLSTFITNHLEEILEEWEVASHARATHDRRGNLAAIRDHLGELLRTIARDLDTSADIESSPRDRAVAHREKSNVEALGEKHGAGRAQQGLSLNHVIAEFPTLRSCLTRLWLRSLQSVTSDDVRDLARFDEAIDLALSKSVSEFIESLNHSRETFLGILGHDLRNPLAAITAAGKLMLEESLAEEDRRTLTQRIVNSGERMQHMIADLLDFARARLGGRIPIARHAVDLTKLLHDAADEVATSHPTRPIRVERRGNLHGNWDERRIGQAIGNLLGNAVEHGAPDTPIDLSAIGDEREVKIAVHNQGPAIPEARRKQIFQPPSDAVIGRRVERDPNHLGLGLFITNAIIAGHGGRIEVDSPGAGGNTFTIHLPRE
jgi:signal transduction histidine kinase